MRHIEQGPLTIEETLRRQVAIGTIAVFSLIGVRIATGGNASAAPLKALISANAQPHKTPERAPSFAFNAAQRAALNEIRVGQVEKDYFELVAQQAMQVAYERKNINPE